MHLSALMEIGLALFIVTIIVNAIAQPAGLGRYARHAVAGALRNWE